MDISTYPVNYKVRVTPTARKQGEKLGISEKDRLWVIDQMKLVKHWPDIADHYDHEPAFGAIEFKFNLKDHWIRIFVYRDDDRKIMWVITVLAKKTNKLLKVDQIRVETAISVIKREIQNFKKQESNKVTKLKVLEGGKNE